VDSLSKHSEWTLQDIEDMTENEVCVCCKLRDVGGLFGPPFGFKRTFSGVTVTTYEGVSLQKLVDGNQGQETKRHCYFSTLKPASN